MEVDIITLQELFTFKVDRIDQETIVGTLSPTGLRPTFLDKFEKRGVPLTTTVFQERALSFSGERHVRSF